MSIFNPTQFPDGVTIIYNAGGFLQVSGAVQSGLIEITPTSSVPTIPTNGYAIWASTAAGNLIFKPANNNLGFLFEDASANPLIQFNPIDDTIAMFVKVKTYNNIATAGATGLTPTYASATTGVQTATQSNFCTYTPPAAAGNYMVNITVDNTSGTNTGTTTITIAYKNSQGTSITATVPLAATSGSFGTTATGASTSFFGHIPISTDNSATAINVTATVAGSVHFNATAWIIQAS